MMVIHGIIFVVAGFWILEYQLAVNVLADYSVLVHLVKHKM